jgi:hypothetical protein
MRARSWPPSSRRSLAGTPAHSVRGGTISAFRNHRAGGDDGAGADAAAVEDGCAHANEHLVLHHAAVDGGVVANGHPVAHDDRVGVALAVQHGAVLHVGVRAHADGVHVAAQYGVHPHRGALAQRDVTDDLGGKVNVTTGGNLGQTPLIAANHRKQPRGSLLDPSQSVKEKPRRRVGWRFWQTFSQKGTRIGAESPAVRGEPIPEIVYF